MATGLNGLHQWRGLEAVRALVEAADYVAEKDFMEDEILGWPLATNATK